MSAPIDFARVATQIATAGTSHAINVGTPDASTLLIVFVRFAAAPGTVGFTGYTQLAADTTDASDDETRVYYRFADGAEGATDTLTTVNSVKLGAICWRVLGAESPTVSAPVISTVAIGTTTLNTANPATVTPAGSPRDTLYIALAGGDGEATYTVAPTNYTNLVTSDSGTAGAVATNCFMGGASRQILASTSDDPGVFTHPAHTTGWAAYTIAIRGSKSLIYYDDRMTRNILLRR